MGNSYMVYPDGRTVPFESLSTAEKAECWERIAKRIGQAITDYVNRHPEHYELVRNALLESGGTLIEETRIDRNGREVEVTHGRT